MVILITMKKDEKTGCYINEVNGRKYAYIQKSHVWNKEKKQAETSLEYVMMKGISSQRGNTW